LNNSKVMRVESLDELAGLFFPNNKKHQRIFLTIFVELKWSESQFLTTLEPIADQHGFSRRSLETVRAKMRQLGLIDHVSRFNQKQGCKEGWVFSNKFSNAARHLSSVLDKVKDVQNPDRKAKDKDLFRYV
jgi:hypothetical protein